jgi:hypothetical protein
LVDVNRLLQQMFQRPREILEVSAYQSAVPINKLSTKILTTMNFTEVGNLGESVTITERDVDNSMVGKG